MCFICVKNVIDLFNIFEERYLGAHKEKQYHVKALSSCLTASFADNFANSLDPDQARRLCGI